MAHQATLNSGPRSPIDGVLNNLGDLSTNVVTLASLQAQLAAADLQESSRRALPGMIAVAAGTMLALASVTVVLAAVAAWLVQAGWLTTTGALALVGIGGLIVSGALLAFALGRLRSSFSTLRRSREELERNIAWLGTILKQSGRYS